MARNIFRSVEDAVDAVSTKAPDWAEVGTVLFRVLKRFPEAYRAVLQELAPVAPPLTPSPS